MTLVSKTGKQLIQRVFLELGPHFIGTTPSFEHCRGLQTQALTAMCWYPPAFAFKVLRDEIHLCDTEMLLKSWLDILYSDLILLTVMGQTKVERSFN